MRDLSHPILWTGSWVALVGVALWSRPLLPIDETRYFAVAWEMWKTGEYLVPQLNGELYHHKPPLFFWLINFVWGTVGMDHVFGRAVGPIFGFGSVLLTWVLARLLWPSDPLTHSSAPWVLVGCLLWAITTTLSMFDTMVMFFSLLSTIGAFGAFGALANDGTVKSKRFLGGFILCGVALGLGVLAKGPVILVFTLPVLLTYPFWCDRRNSNSTNNYLWWYLGVVSALTIAIIVSLSWALPAVERGGPEFAQSIFWAQSADRMVGGFSHSRPWWWYAPLLFLVLFPWVWLPTVWKSLGRVKWRQDLAFRFCFFCFVPALLILSLFNDKQPHYLLPALPAFALLVARSLSAHQIFWQPRKNQLPALLLFVSAGCLILGMLFSDYKNFLLFELSLTQIFVLAVPVMVIAILGLIVQTIVPKRTILVLSLQTVGLVILLHASLVLWLRPFYDLEEAAKHVAALSENSGAVAYVGKYHGQFHYLGKLVDPIDVISGDKVVDWFGLHPMGAVIYSHRDTADVDGGKPLYRQPYRGRVLAIWDRRGAMRDATIFTR